MEEERCECEQLLITWISTANNQLIDIDNQAVVNTEVGP